jgi:hypothetical protein
MKITIDYSKAFKALFPVTIAFIGFVGFFITAHFTGFLS